MSQVLIPPNSTTVVSVRNVYKEYKGGISVLQNYSMTVEEGHIYGLLGSSGCGKSTVLSCILGIKHWDSGTITVFGENVRHGTSNQHIGYMPQDNALYNQLTVMEMMHFYAELYHIHYAKQRMTFILNLLNLDGYGCRRIVTLSGGQTRRVSLALTMIHNPKLLILDEPTVGLDALLRKKIWDYFFKLTSENQTTIIITTHYIEEVKYSHMVGIMRRGTLLVEEDPKALMTVYNTPLLEDVVLKIFKMDSLVSQKTTTLISPALNNNTHENDNGNGPIMRSITDIGHKPIKNSLMEPFQRIWAYNKVIWINFLRQPVFIMMIFVLPVTQILSTDFVLGKLPLSSPFGIVNREMMKGPEKCSHHIVNDTCDLTLLSCMYVKNLNSSIYLKPIEFPTTEVARLGVERGEITGYIEIPDNYSSSAIERAMLGKFTENKTIDGTLIKVHLDMSNIITTYTVLTAINGGFGDFVKELSTICDIDFRRFYSPFLFRNPVYGKEDTTITEYMLSPLVTCFFFEIAFFITPFILINDMDAGIFERSRLVGLKLSEMMCGIFLAILAVAAIQTIVSYIVIELVLGFYLPGFHTQTTFWAFVVLCLVVAFCNSALGLMIGIMFKNTVAVVHTGIFIFPILLALIGVFQALETIPNPYRTLIFYIIPNVSIVKPLRWILNRGVDITHRMVWPGVFVTVGWGVAFTLICAFLLRRL